MPIGRLSCPITLSLDSPMPWGAESRAYNVEALNWAPGDPGPVRLYDEYEVLGLALAEGAIKILSAPEFLFLNDSSGARCFGEAPS